MAIEEALFSLLTGDPRVKALLATRVFHVRTPEVGEPDASLPTIAYLRVSTTRAFTMDVGAAVTVLARSRFQFDCMAADPDTASKVARTITAVMRGFKGPVADIEVKGIFDDTETDRDIYNPQTKIFAVQKDFQVSYLD